MYTDREFLIPKEKKSLDWCTKCIITLPAISLSIWCLANTAYNALIYEHLHNILKNVTVHIET
jgi:hypothetical protein